MKKRILWLIFALCTALFLPMAAAEEDAYTPGEITKTLLREAFDAGKIITGDMTLALDIAPELFTESEEEAAQMQAVLDLIEAVTLTGGIGKIEGGYRLELSAQLAPENKESVSVDAALDLTPGGVSLESDLIEGEKITARWETILALCGADQETISMIMSLKDTDFEALISQLLAQIGPMLDMAAQIAAPYGETIAAFAANLPMETEENVAADDYYPATAMRVYVSFTQKDIGELIIALSDQLETDETLAPILDALLAEEAMTIQIEPADDDDQAEQPSTAIASTAELCEALRQEAALMTDETPYVLMLGLDDAGTPMYAELYDVHEDNSGFILSVSAYETDAAGTYSYDFTFSTSEDGENVDDAFSLYGTVAADGQDAYAADVTMSMVVFEDGVNILSLDYVVDASAVQTEEGLPAYQTDFTMNMFVSDEGEEVTAVMGGTNVQAQTKTGELTSAAATMDMYIGDQAVTMDIVETFVISATEDGFTGSYAVSEKMPDLGFNDYGITGSICAKDHDAAASAALQATALEDATNDDMNALMNRVYAALSEKLTVLVQILPPEVLELMSE